MFKVTLYIALIFTTCIANAQKRLSQTYDAAGITELYIKSNEIFKIKITTAKTDQITVNTIIDGEIFESTLLNTTLDEKVLEITTGKTPDYIPFNDKLSAHKVMAIELEIIVPVGFDLSVYSTLASLETTGELGKVRIDLGRGHFYGKGFRFRESATINTISGSITIDVNNVHTTAQSRNGTVVIPEELTGSLPLHLESLHGDIIVRKSL